MTEQAKSEFTRQLKTTLEESLDTKPFLILNRPNLTGSTLREGEGHESS